MDNNGNGMKQRTIWMMHDDRGEFWPNFAGNTRRNVLEQVKSRMVSTWKELHSCGFRIVKVHVMKVQ